MSKVGERRALRNKAAYTLVDLSELPEDIRAMILEDASAGGKEFGVRVVEETVNGPARAAIYGVYDHDVEAWNAAKEEFGISGEEIDDSEVTAGTLDDGSRESALRAAAQEQVNADAERIRVADEAELKKIVGDEEPPAKTTGTNKAPR